MKDYQWLGSQLPNETIKGLSKAGITTTELDGKRGSQWLGLVRDGVTASSMSLALAVFVYFSWT
ncbi:hypothetical protein INR49_005715, partial [Caranx melampygus]